MTECGLGGLWARPMAGLLVKGFSDLAIKSWSSPALGYDWGSKGGVVHDSGTHDRNGSEGGEMMAYQLQS